MLSNQYRQNLHQLALSKTLLWLSWWAAFAVLLCTRSFGCLCPTTSLWHAKQLWPSFSTTVSHILQRPRCSFPRRSVFFRGTPRRSCHGQTVPLRTKPRLIPFVEEARRDPSAGPQQADRNHRLWFDLRTARRRAVTTHGPMGGRQWGREGEGRGSWPAGGDQLSEGFGTRERASLNLKLSWSWWQSLFFCFFRGPSKPSGRTSAPFQTGKTVFQGFLSGSQPNVCSFILCFLLSTLTSSVSKSSALVWYEYSVLMLVALEPWSSERDGCWLYESSLTLFKSQALIVLSDVGQGTSE